MLAHARSRSCRSLFEPEGGGGGARACTAISETVSEMPAAAAGRPWGSRAAQTARDRRSRRGYSRCCGRRVGQCGSADHAAIGDDADAGDQEAGLEPLDDRQEGGHVDGVARPHPIADLRRRPPASKIWQVTVLKQRKSDTRRRHRRPRAADHAPPRTSSRSGCLPCARDRPMEISSSTLPAVAADVCRFGTEQVELGDGRRGILSRLP